MKSYPIQTDGPDPFRASWIYSPIKWLNKLEEAQLCIWQNNSGLKLYLGRRWKPQLFPVKELEDLPHSTNVAKNCFNKLNLKSDNLCTSFPTEFGGLWRVLWEIFNKFIMFTLKKKLKLIITFAFDRKTVNHYF
jgi:hypothetical protein